MLKKIDLACNKTILFMLTLIFTVLFIDKTLYASEFEDVYDLAQKNDPDAQYQLAIMYYRGKGIKCNWEEASKWFHESARNGHIEAQYMLGHLYEKGEHGVVRKDLSVSIEYYTKAAKQGHIKALYRASIILNKGYKIPNLGVVRNNDTAKEWVQKILTAAENGNAEALTCLGNMYYNGEWVNRNQQKAIINYRKAAEKGDEEAQYKLGHEYELGNLVKQDYNEAAKWYRKAALQDNHNAQFNLGLLCLSGKGTNKNLHEALKWLYSSAIQGNVQALNIIASLAMSGNAEALDVLGIFAKDYHHVSAVSVFKELAQHNNRYALEIICILEEQQYPGIDSILRSLSKNENAEIQYNLGDLYFNGKNIKINNKRAFSYYRRAAEKGHSGAQYMIGHMYNEGIGIEKDKWQAVEWWRKAATHGNIKAQEELAKRNLSY